MGNIREYTNEMRQKCADLNKSDGGYKNSYTSENAITVRVILKTTKAVMHQPVRRLHRRLQLEIFGILWSPNLEIYTIPMTSQQSILKINVCT